MRRLRWLSKQSRTRWLSRILLVRLSKETSPLSRLGLRRVRRPKQRVPCRRTKRTRCSLPRSVRSKSVRPSRRLRRRRAPKQRTSRPRAPEQRIRAGVWGRKERVSCRCPRLLLLSLLCLSLALILLAKGAKETRSSCCGLSALVGRIAERTKRRGSRFPERTISEQTHGVGKNWIPYASDCEWPTDSDHEK